MIPRELQPVANHLWQCTAFFFAAALAAAAAGPARARLRYAIWFSASARLLIPLPWIAAMLSPYSPAAPIHRAFTTSVTATVAQPFRTFASSPFLNSVTSQPDRFPITLLGLLWLTGFLITTSFWMNDWLRLRRIVRDSRPRGRIGGVPVMEPLVPIEPCIFGVFRPTLLLPADLAQNLSAEEFESILSHEFCHIRRRDNLTAAIHAAVQAVFWFFPPVWWIGRRLLEERELACDQAVLTSGSTPETYARSILAVCRFGLRPAAACASGISGPALRVRIEKIMDFRGGARIGARRVFALLLAAMFVIAEPVFTGLVSARLSQAQALPQGEGPQSFGVISVKPNVSGDVNSGFRRAAGGQLNALNITLKMLIAFAWDIPEDRILQAPGWFETDHFDIVAKPENGREEGPRAESPELTQSRASDILRLRTQSLLADRFGLKLHREARQHAIYTLVVDKGGSKNLHTPGGRHDLVNNGHKLTCLGVSMEYLAKIFLTNQMSAPVIDRTGVEGEYDFTLEWTPDGEASANAVFPSFTTALREQLGLRLEPGRGPVDHLVIDAAHKPEAN